MLGVSAAAFSDASDCDQSEGGRIVFDPMHDPLTLAVRALERLTQVKVDNRSFDNFFRANPNIEELLKPRPGRFWADVLRRFSDTNVALLSDHNGEITLFEALVVQGSPSYKRVAALQKFAQAYLFGSLSLKEICGVVTVQTLWRAGARPDVPDEAGRLPVHYAARSCSDHFVSVAMRSPLQLLVPDNEDSTALEEVAANKEQLLHSHWAREQCIPELLATCLLQCGHIAPMTTRALMKRSESVQALWKEVSSSPNAECGLALQFFLERENISMQGAVDEAEWQSSQQEHLMQTRLDQTSSRVALFRNLEKGTLEALSQVEPEELSLRLAKAEADLIRQKDDHRQQLLDLQVQLDQQKALVQQRDEELLQLKADIENRPPAVNSAANASGLCQACGKAPFAPIQAPGGNTSAHGAIAADAKKETGKKKKGKENVSSADKSTTAAASGAKGERETIQQIAASRTMNDKLTGEMKDSYEEILKSLAAAVERLSHDLYESQVHFVQELLQNADDNRYAEGQSESPMMTLHLRATEGSPPYFYTANNELGMTERDIAAICDIARSSKQFNSSKTTGCKGIGFKSVFRVCSRPHILSGKWRFKFSSGGLGMLTPQWICDNEYADLPAEVLEAHRSGRTIIYLPLEAAMVPGIESAMTELESDKAQLLFFRRLTTVNLCYPSGRYVELTAEAVQGGPRCMTTRASWEAGTPTREKNSSESERSSTRFEVFSEREGMLCIALADDEEPPPAWIYSCLPVRPVGFHFSIQAPFHTTASRTDIHRDPFNASLRDGVVSAFLGACAQSESVAKRALSYLGPEPVDSFWRTAWQAILRGMSSVACVATASGGLAEPARCLLHGDLPIVEWISDDVLFDSCGKYFAATSNRKDALRQLGVQTFGLEHLVNIIQYQGGRWLRDQWQKDTWPSFFSELYASLADTAKAELSTLDKLTTLAVFPVEGTEKRSDQKFLAAPQVVVKPLKNIPSEKDYVKVQSKFVGILELQLEQKLSAGGRRFLDLLGMKDLDEESLVDKALRGLLRFSFEGSVSKESEALFWAELDIMKWAYFNSGCDDDNLSQLCRRNLESKAFWSDSPSQWQSQWQAQSQSRWQRSGWELLGASLQYPANKTWRCLNELTVTSIMGVQRQLPDLVADRICKFLAFPVRHTPEPGQPHSLRTPPMRDDEKGLFEWEVFFHALGCKPPQLNRGLGLNIELALMLGKPLSDGDFWRRACSLRGGLEYVDSVLDDPDSGKARRHFSTLPVPQLVGVRKSTVSLHDLFLRDEFRALAGDHLDYIADIPDDERVKDRLRQLGMCLELDQRSLLKCLYIMRLRGVDDVAVAAEMYMRLGSLGYTPNMATPLLLVPRRRVPLYAAPGDCMWESPWRHPFLQETCPVPNLEPHYSRFQDGAAEVVRAWIGQDHFSPAKQADILCSTLAAAIKKAQEGQQAEALRPPSNLLWPKAYASERWAAKVLRIFREVLGHFLELLDETDFISCQEALVVIRGYFTRQPLIVIPNFEGVTPGQDPVSVHLVPAQDAYWSVRPELEDHPSAEFALCHSYGDMGEPGKMQAFFVSIGVEAEKSYFFSVPSGDFLERPSGLREGLPVRADPAASAPPPAELGVRRSSSYRWERADQRSPSMLSPQQRASAGLGGDRPRQRTDSASSSAAAAAAAAAAAGARGSISNPASLPRRNWRRVGLCPPFKVETSDGAGHRPPPGFDSTPLVEALRLFGLEPYQVTLAHDPSERCVCDQELKLDIRSAWRVRDMELENEEAQVFWCLELAHAVTHSQFPNVSIDEAWLRAFIDNVMPRLRMI